LTFARVERMIPPVTRTLLSARMVRSDASQAAYCARVSVPGPSLPAAGNPNFVVDQGEWGLYETMVCEAHATALKSGERYIYNSVET
jgi:hypothetical protein